MAGQQKGGFKELLITIILPVVLCIGIITLAVFYLFRGNAVSHTNSLKRQAHHDYEMRDFVKAVSTYKHLVDSLHVQDEELLLNYGNAAFLAAGLAWAPTDVKLAKPDSTDGDTTKTALNYGDIAAQEYSKLSASGRTRITSMAANQLGVLDIRNGEKNPSPTALDSALRQSLVNFREALIKNPNNDSARYNYELVKKLVEYPANIETQVKGLVAKRQYRQARTILEAAMLRDKRIKQQQQELLKRIKDVVGIDSLDTKTSL